MVNTVVKCSHTVMYSLRAITFGNDIQLSVESLQLPEILGLEYPQEFILNLTDFAFTGNPVKIFNITENVFYQIGLHLR